jgi:hypothetical protein
MLWSAMPAVGEGVDVGKEAGGKETEGNDEIDEIGLDIK